MTTYLNSAIEHAAMCLYYRQRAALQSSLPWSSLTAFEKEAFRQDFEAALSVYEDHERQTAA